MLQMYVDLFQDELDPNFYLKQYQKYLSSRRYMEFSGRHLVGGFERSSQKSINLNYEVLTSVYKVNGLISVTGVT